MPDTVKDVPAKGSMGDLDGGEIDILEMMGRASGTYHWQFFVILKRSSRRQQDLGFHLPALPSTANGLSDQTHHKIEYVCVVQLQGCCHRQHCSGGGGG